MSDRRPPGLLRFDFSACDGTPSTTVFPAPVRVIAAATLAEVRPALGAVERALAEGWYAAGFVAYEAAPAFDPALGAHPPGGFPLVWFGLSRRPLDADPGEPVDPFPHGTDAAPTWHSPVSADDHRRAVAAVRQAILDGEVYQANITFPLETVIPTDSLDARYRRLRDAHQVPYAASLDLGRWRVLSLSPELFFRIEGRRLTTRPMKGTAPRGRWAAEDADREGWLRASEKNRAENIMIVDLARNDVGRVAEVGSVAARAICDVERYRSVFQLTSTVEGRLRDDVTLTDVFAALFPAGSITGAPKVSATHLIARTEPHRRGVYCGAVGYATPSGDAVFNVAIRTAITEVPGGRTVVGVGGGITWDSQADDEYEEAWHKATFLTVPPAFDLLETMRLDAGRIARLDRHLARLEASAAYFGRPVDRRAVEAELAARAARQPTGTWRLRLTVDPQGRPQVTTTPVAPRPTALPPEVVVLARTPIDRDDPFLCHKTTNRAAYEVRRAEAPAGVFDVLLWNSGDEITESTIGNLVVELDGRLVTPARTSGLLDGVFRQTLLDAGTLREAVVRRSDLGRATRLWLINSLRGWIPVRMARSGEPGP